MLKHNFQFQLQVSFIKEGDAYIAYTPALDISTSGNSLEQAKQRFEELSQIFFEECIQMGTLDSVLQDLGWQKKAGQIDNGGWVPPTIIGQENHRVLIHA